MGTIWICDLSFLFVGLRQLAKRDNDFFICCVENDIIFESIIGTIGPYSNAATTFLKSITVDTFTYHAIEQKDKPEVIRTRASAKGKKIAKGNDDSEDDWKVIQTCDGDGPGDDETISETG